MTTLGAPTPLVNLSTTTVHQVPPAPVTTSGGVGSSAAIIVVLAIVVFLVLARMLRGVFAMVGSMLSSAGSVFTVLVGLLGVGTVLLTTVIVVFVNR